jgi:hypothetical protein
MTNKFINKLIEVESENLKKNKIYNNVFDKYLNGHCEDLVNYLLLNNEDGEKIKIKGIFQEFDEDQIVIHYIYKLNDKYYDINGEFDTIEDFEVLRVLVESLGTDKKWNEYIEFLDKNPTIRNINSNHVRNEGYAKSILND